MRIESVVEEEGAEPLPYDEGIDNKISDVSVLVKLLKQALS